MVSGFKIPNVAIVGNNNSLSWVRIFDDIKLIKILIYLYNNQVISSNCVRFTLSDMIVSCGYKLNRNKGCINDRFKLLLNELKSIGVIDCTFNILNLKANDFVSITYLGIEQNEEGKDICFTYCPYDVFNKIMLTDDGDISDNYYLLLVYLYIASRINVRDKNDSIQISGGRPEVCWFTYDTFYNDTNISRKSFSKCIAILKKLKLIDYDNIGKVIDNKGNIYIANNVYVLTSTQDYKYHLKQGLKESLYYYEEVLEWKVK